MIPYKWRVLVEDFPLPCLIISTFTNKCKEHMPLCHIILTLHMTSPEIVDVERILGLACWFRKISITELSWILLKTFHKLVSIPRSSIFWFIMEQQVQAWRCCVSPWVGGATCPDRGRQVRQNKRARREAVLEENFWWGDGRSSSELFVDIFHHADSILKYYRAQYPNLWSMENL